MENVQVESTKDYRVIAVLFELSRKRYYFEIAPDAEYKKDEKVIVETSRGREIGIICGRPMVVNEKKLVLPLKPIEKKASKQEMLYYEQLKKDAKEAELVCKAKIAEFMLPMKVLGAEFTFDKTKIIFYFLADGRIDFRDLVKDLATQFKVRIELRQIGVRDEARILGTMGVCGKELCCRTFINRFASVSVKMARDQGLVINPTKISGVCGRLLCCLTYEHQHYEEALKLFPAVNQVVSTKEFGEGKVLSISPLNGYIFMNSFSKGYTKVDIKDVTFDKKVASKLKAALREPKEIPKEILEVLTKE